MQIAGLEEIKDRPFGELSGGQKQRVLFGIAICGDPDLLFLDEPTVGLDVEARRLMWSQIRILIARGKTVLLTTHYLNEADALADRILVLQQGRDRRRRHAGRDQGARHGQAGSLHQPACRSTKFAQIPGVVSVKADRNAFELQVNAAEPVVRELLQRDSWLADLEVTNAGLEEAFLALTKNHNADSKEKTNMATTTFPAALAVRGARWRSTFALYAKEAKYELLNNTAHPDLRHFDAGVSR